jgi:hypothetical protein
MVTSLRQMSATNIYAFCSIRKGLTISDWSTAIGLAATRPEKETTSTKKINASKLALAFRRVDIVELHGDVADCDD